MNRTSRKFSPVQWTLVLLTVIIVGGWLIVDTVAGTWQSSEYTIQQTLRVYGPLYPSEGRVVCQDESCERLMSKPLIPGDTTQQLTTEKVPVDTAKRLGQTSIAFLVALLIVALVGGMPLIYGMPRQFIDKLMRRSRAHSPTKVGELQ